MKPNIFNPAFGHLLIDPGSGASDQPLRPNAVKPPEIDCPSHNLDVGRIHLPAVAKRQISGNTNRSTINESQTYIFKAEDIALQRCGQLELVEGERCLCIGKGKIALANPDSNRQCLYDTTRAKSQIDTAVRHPDEPLVLASANIDKNISKHRTQIKRDNLELRAGTVDTTGNVDGEIRQIAAGEAFLQPFSRLVGKASGPICIYLFDGPSVASKAERQLRRRTMKCIHVT